MMAANNQAASGYQRDLIFTDQDFSFIRRLVMDQTGISLADHKRELVYGRLSKRLRNLGLNNFTQYCSHLEHHEDEVLELVNAITTNLTSFFRESYHFDYLHDHLLPELLQRNAVTRRIRIWSAGCSTGEEPYSIAMTVRDAVPGLRDWDLKILATDIDSNVLAKAAAGIYPAERAASVPPAYRNRFLKKGGVEDTGMVRVHDDVRSLVTFRQLNLMHQWPMKGPFDIIFCRNVVIYFDKETQRSLFGRYADMLTPDGHLFVGHSETLFKVCDRFSLIGRTIYRRIR
jgi:chemotaxis protein methyltransferase CheR